jgi:3-hydroxybutyryl-CoA dehydratase
MHIGLRFERSVRLSARSITAFAKRAGDMNQLHHDAHYAQRTRFGGLIASGTQTASLLLGLLATEATRFPFSLGLECAFRFLAPVPPGEKLALEWRVTGVKAKRSLGGDLVNLTGGIRDSSGRRLLAARAVILASAHHQSARRKSGTHA